MSKEKYFELYRQYLNHTISREDYQDLMEWVSDEQNDVTLRRFMEKLWTEKDWAVEDRPHTWSEFKNRFRKSHSENRRPKVIALFQVWSYAAAVAVLMVAVYGVYQYLQPATILYQTAYGETQEILLDDGSIVTLNANSVLEWDADWKQSGERHVRLTGEAFFDVEHTPDNDAFTVETNDLRIRVLGTTFNVMARHKQTDVTLETGKIELNLNRSEDNSYAMEPGDRVNFSSEKNTFKKEKVKTITESANWLDGVLRFEDVSVAAMFKEIEDQYGKKLVDADTSVLNRRLFTGIPYEDWAVAKEAIELALDVKIEERNNELYIK